MTEELDWPVPNSEEQKAAIAKARARGLAVMRAKMAWGRAALGSAPAPKPKKKPRGRFSRKSDDE